MDQGEFRPLDGQQRLTTIFLIHWVLSQRAGKHDLDVDDYFSYQTRRSSELFCLNFSRRELISIPSQMDKLYLPISRKKQPDENPTIGILLCTEKNDTAVRLALPEDNKTILASKYQLFLPTEEQLRAEVEKQKQVFLQQHEEQNREME